MCHWSVFVFSLAKAMGTMPWNMPCDGNARCAHHNAHLALSGLSYCVLSQVACAFTKSLDAPIAILLALLLS